MKASSTLDQPPSLSQLSAITSPLSNALIWYGFLHDDAVELMATFTYCQINPPSDAVDRARFSLQARGPNRRIAGLPQFVTVQGGRVVLSPRPAGLALSGAAKCERLSSTRTNQCESHCVTTIDFKDKVAGVP